MSNAKQELYIHANSLKELFENPSFYNCSWSVRNRSYQKLMERISVNNDVFRANDGPDYRMFYSAAARWEGYDTIKSMAELYCVFGGMESANRPYVPQLSSERLADPSVDLVQVAVAINEYNSLESIACKHISKIYHEV